MPRSRSFTSSSSAVAILNSNYRVIVIVSTEFALLNIIFFRSILKFSFKNRVVNMGAHTSKSNEK